MIWRQIGESSELDAGPFAAVVGPAAQWVVFRDGVMERCGQGCDTADAKVAALRGLAEEARKQIIDAARRIEDMNAVLAELEGQEVTR